MVERGAVGVPVGGGDNLPEVVAEVVAPAWGGVAPAAVGKVAEEAVRSRYTYKFLLSKKVE